MNGNSSPKRSKPSYRKQLIQAELEAHLADLTDEFVASGHSPAEAKQLAANSFGDVAAIETELDQLYQPGQLKFNSVHLVIIIYGLIAVILYSVHSITAALELALLRWVYIGFIGLVWLINYWFIHYVGLKRTDGIWLVASFTVLISTSLTIVLDIDHFETNLHALVFSLFVIVSLKYFWPKLTTRLKQFCLYGYSSIVIWSILFNHPIFAGWYEASCLFITPDTIALQGTLSMCTQVHWLSPLLWPLYVVTLTSILYMSKTLWQYWHNRSTALSRKFWITAILLSCLTVPLFIYDINNYGQLDVVTWQQDINAAYLTILGRYPEDKDIEFYAQTRAYQHMSRVRDTLYQSTERKIKINQLYQELLGRPATQAELEHYIQSRQSISTIYDELN